MATGLDSNANVLEKAAFDFHFIKHLRATSGGKRPVIMALTKSIILNF